jgi:membrane associated rhomboid family serine protease
MAASTESPGAGGVPLPPTEFSLRRPRFWSLRFSIIFVLLVLAALGYYASLWPASMAGGTTLALAVELAVPLGACLAAIVMRWAARPRSVPPLLFHDEYFSAPRHPEARRAVRVEYSEILAVDLRGGGGREQLFIGTRDRLLTLPRLAFTAPDAVDRALRELYLRILRRPQGPRIVEQIARRRKIALVAMSRSATATTLLVSVAVAVFALEYATGALVQPFGPVRFGAAAPVLVREGEVYRLLASVFLHANAVHLYFDGLAFFFLGAVLERVLGRARFILVYGVSGLGGAVLAAAMGHRLFAANASAATFGLLAAYFLVSRRFGSDLPLALRQPARWWLLMAGLNALLPLAVHEVDPFAMAGGLVAGLVSCWLVMDGADLQAPAAAASRGLKVLAGVVATLFGAGFVSGLEHALSQQEDLDLRFARAVLASPDARPGALEVLARKVVRYPAASPDLLAAASSAATQARSRQPGDAGAVDVWAATQYRLGALEVAIDTGRELLAAQPAPYYAEHLARYLARRLESAGPLSRGGAEAWDVSVEVHPPARGEHARALVRLGRPSPGLVLLALARREGETVGLLRLEVPALGIGEHDLPLPAGEVWPKEAAYDIALVDGDCADCGGPRSATFWSLEGQVHDLP